MKQIQIAGSDGPKMPVVGLGTWKAQKEEIETAVGAALNCGYKHIDTAFNYNNEEAIGEALKKWFDSDAGKREDLFITTKLPNFGNRPEDVEKFLKLSLNKLQLDYIDLYLIHMPFAFACNEETLTPSVDNNGEFVLDMNDNVATWKAMEEQVRKGLVKAIGLSNFNEDQVKEIYDNAEIKPAVLQVELHAHLQQKPLRELSKKFNIAVTAYAPLGSPASKSHFKDKYDYHVEDFPDILGHPLVVELAKKHSKGPGQILLRHLIQQDIIVIPKSTNPERIKSNIDIFDFELSDQEMEKLNGLDQGESGRIFDFLFFKGVEKHPHYPFKLRL